MTDKDRVLETELAADFDDVVGVAGKIGVFCGIVGPQIGAARPDMVEKNGPKPVLKGGRHMPPHVLVAAKSVRENDRRTARSGRLNIIADANRHTALQTGPI